MGNSAKRDARKIDKALRRRKALELRGAGATYEQIAQQLGCNRGNVWMDVTEAIRDIYREPAQHVLQLELRRLDAMLLGVWAKAKSGDCQAIDRVLRIQERRAAYLGLDSPKLLRFELERELSTHLERLKVGLAPDVYEHVLGVLAGELGASPADAAPEGAEPTGERAD